MPDWTYQTILKPVLFRLRPEKARDLALGAMGRLARFPSGTRVIQFLGHMGPDARLRVDRAGIAFPSPVGLGCGLDPQLSATNAFSEFGFGYIEIGPIVARSTEVRGPWRLDPSQQILQLSPPHAALTPDEAKLRLRRAGAVRLPILARIEPRSADDAAATIEPLRTIVQAFVVPLQLLDKLGDGPALPRPAPVFVAITTCAWIVADQRDRILEACRTSAVAGLLIESNRTAAGTQQLGPADRPVLLQTIRDIRAAVGSAPTLIAAAGIHSPADALDAVQAGADMVQVDSGLVFSGPGLPKRINEALLYRRLKTQPSAPPPAAGALPPRLAAQSWFWAVLLGASLLAGGFLAMAIAVTRVVLPYDEALTGLTRAELDQINPKLLSFMTHDRVTLAGAMIAVGIQYTALAWFGVRRGMHWALVAVVASALAGFFTFFSFLGFGYFDPFHAFVSAILLQLTLLAMHATLGVCETTAAPDLHNNDAWRAHQWGQLMFVIHGVLLIAAGATIAFVGMTKVFVAEDLEFLGTTVDALTSAHPQLIPLVAHDRATLGGMLLASGLATMLSALWGFRRGHAWLWWSLMLAGNLAYLATLAVHMNVGYETHKHLLPVYGGLVWLWAAGMFSYPFMAGRDDELEAEWCDRLATTSPASD